MGRGIAVTVFGILAFFGFTFYWTWNVESLSESIGMIWWVIIFVAGILALPLAAVVAIRRSSRKTVSFMGSSKRSREIQSSGHPASATVLSIGEISPGRSVTVGGQPYLRLVLRIDDRTRPPYEVTADTIIAHSQLAQFQPGAMIAVMVDPDDPQAVVIAPDRATPGPVRVAIDSPPGMTPVIVAEGWSQTDLIKLERHGKHGLAKVVSAAATGRFEGANPIEQIDYEILLPGEEPYTVTKQVGLPPDAVPRIESTIGKSADLRVSWILLTNDDGIDSPALAPFAAALADLGTVRVVVPDRERSWIGKAITRFDPIRVEKVGLDGGVAWTCTGFPADAVQIGVHGLFDEPPSLVVSGINVGYNHGAAFLMSSGTVGAAVEGWVSGIPSIAVSTGANGDWSAWKRKVHEREALLDWERLATVATSLVDEARGSGLLELADVVTINLPFDTTIDTPRRVTTVARVGYDRLFRDQGDGIFTHDFGGGFVEFDAIDGTDLAAARENHVSITPLCMPRAATVPQDIRSRLER